LLVLGLSVLGLRLSTGLENLLQAHLPEPFLVVALFCIIGYLAFWLVSLPFDYYKGYLVEHRFELSNEGVGDWFKDNLKASILLFFVVFAFVEGVYNFMWLSPGYWWFFVWLVSAFVIVIFMYVAPVLVMPLFYKFPELKDEKLLGILRGLAEKAGIKIIGVFEMKSGAKTKKSTAALTGIGGTRRMLLSDTFLSNSSYDEIECTMGHEIGHHVYGHIWKSTVLFLGAALVMLFLTNQILHASIGFFGLGRVDSASSLPLLALSLGSLYVVLIPLMNTISRRWEGNCDQYALDVVGKPDAFISKMIRLCDQNLRYAYPSRLVETILYDHPSGRRRIERGLAYKRAHATPSV
jgi:STE24 endopeptidase